MKKPKNKIISIKLVCIICSLLIISLVTVSCVSKKGDNSTDELNFLLTGTRWYEGFYLDLYLYNDIVNAENERTFKVHALPIQKLPDSFVYNGKSCAQYEEEYQESKKLVEKLQDLLKEGDALKYGEKLYTTGTPDGEVWSEKKYNERTQKYYGEKILKSYIVNGEFLKQELENDILLAKAEMNKRNSIMNEACRAGERIQLEKALSVFKLMDKEAIIEDNIISLTVTKNAIIQMPNIYYNQYVIRYPLYATPDISDF